MKILCTSVVEYNAIMRASEYLDKLSWITWSWRKFKKEKHTIDREVGVIEQFCRLHLENLPSHKGPRVVSIQTAPRYVGSRFSE